MSGNENAVRSRIAQVLAENSVLTLATGEGSRLWAATMYYLEEGTDLYCVVKPGARSMENLKDTPRVAITVDSQQPGRFLREVARAVIMGPLDEEPSL